MRGKIYFTNYTLCNVTRHAITNNAHQVSREQSRQDKTQLKEEVDELRGLLDARDGEIKVDRFYNRVNIEKGSIALVFV